MGLKQSISPTVLSSRNTLPLRLKPQNQRKHVPFLKPCFMAMVLLWWLSETVQLPFIKMMYLQCISFLLSPTLWVLTFSIMTMEVISDTSQTGLSNGFLLLLQPMKLLRLKLSESTASTQSPTASRLSSMLMELLLSSMAQTSSGTLWSQLRTLWPARSPSSMMGASSRNSQTVPPLHTPRR